MKVGRLERQLRHSLQIVRDEERPVTDADRFMDTWREMRAGIGLLRELLDDLEVELLVLGTWGRKMLMSTGHDEGLAGGGGYLISGGEPAGPAGKRHGWEKLACEMCGTPSTFRTYGLCGRCFDDVASEDPDLPRNWWLERHRTDGMADRVTKGDYWKKDDDE